MMCQACTEDRHWDCGRQTWCECDCDPEAAEIDEALSHDSAFANDIRDDDIGDDDWRESSESDLEDLCVHGVPFDEDCEDCEDGEEEDDESG